MSGVCTEGWKSPACCSLRRPERGAPAPGHRAERVGRGIRGPENKPFIVALWVLGDLQGLNEGEEAGAGVGAGVHCHLSALPGGGERAPCTCSRTGLAGQTPVPSCFLSGAITGMSQAWGKGVGGERTERVRR